MDYEKLYKAYYLQVYSYTISLAKNREIAEEITQNTFYKAVSTTSQFKGKSDELTWLCSIAKNLYHDEMRSRQRVADVSEINDLPSNENVENSVADSDMAFRIHLVLHRLEEPYKEVFQLRVFGELSFSQIAAIFGKTESWARVTYHRAKLKIQERMDEKHEKQCDIVRDILPLYVDGACSEASAEMVKEHLNACADCNAIYQKLLSHTSEDVLHEESESVIMRHEAKEKQRGRKKITIAVLVSIALCIIAIFTALFLLPINIAYEPVKINFPFEVEDVENVEMYHYDGVPASAEKKVVVAENDIKTLYDKFKGLSLKDKTTEETAGADVTSFRFNLSDGTSYDLIYACYGVKNGELKSAAGGFKYFTSADIGSYWNNLNTELEAIPINESELP